MKHSANLAKVKKGLIQTERLHKAAIRRGDGPAIELMARMHTLVVGMVAEASLRKTLSDPDGFNPREHDALLLRRSQIDRWKSAVEFAFRRHYSVPFHQDLTQFSLGRIPNSQFDQIQKLLADQLEPIIGDRNKTAHAQWVWQLNSKETAFTGLAAPPLNYRAINCRSEIIITLDRLIGALAVSEPTFQRDFNVLYGRITTLIPKLDGSDYPIFVAQLKATQRGHEELS